MSGSSSDAEASQAPNDRKRKRSQDTAVNGVEIRIEIPPPSTAALANLHTFKLSTVPDTDSTSRDPSSPVESFTPSLRPDEVPRIGIWVLPTLTDEIRVDPPDYSSQSILSQIPYVDQWDSDDYRHWSQSQQRKARTATPSSPTHAYSAAPAAQSSTPVENVAPSLPSPIRSPIAKAPSPFQASPLLAAQSSATADTSSMSSVGWSALPLPEVIELMHQSVHVPDLLKEEIERFLLRSKRSSAGQSQSGSLRTASRRSPTRSVAVSTDDSETQEDNYLRTKKVWFMDLLLANSQRFSQSPSSSNQPRAVVLLLDIVEGSFDVQEVEEKLAAILRNDRRYSVWYDCNGRRWQTQSQPTAVEQAETDAASRTFQLQSKIEELQKECEVAHKQRQAAEKEVSQLREQHEFVRELYDRASSAATAAQDEVTAGVAKISRLEFQLKHGLDLHRDISNQAAAKWKQEIKRVNAQNELLLQQARITDGAEVRQKAAMWDAYQQGELDKETARQARIAAHEAKRRQMLLDLGVGPSNTDDGAGPFAAPRENNNNDADDDMDELAALAREAAEAGDDALESGGRGKRQRRSVATAPELTAEEVQTRAAELEAASVAAALALEDARQDIDDHFESFMPRPSSTITVEQPSGLDAFSALPPLVTQASTEIREVLELDTQSMPSQHLDMDTSTSPWSSSVPHDEASLLADTLQPYTQE